MSVTPPNPGDRESMPPPAASSLPPVPDAGPAAGNELPVVGQLWRGLYQVSQVVGDAPVPRAWRALRMDTGEDVTLRAVAARLGSARPSAWRALESLSDPHLPRAHPAVELGAQRIEVQATPAGQPLPEWRGRRAIEIAQIEPLVRALAAALGALHERGLGHFAVRPEHVFVEEKDGALRVTLAGFEQMTLCDQAELIPIPVDPFYAPPEAAGLYQHSPGAVLLAWDWWSLGRVIQETMLGRHVLGVLLQRDVSRVTPELTTRAEALLLEREAGAARAGGVDAMPALDKRLELLLRGLLTSSRDGRWGREQVDGWLRGESPKDYYRLPRNERLFRWRDRAYVVGEAAEQLRTAENWPEALVQVWEPTQPGTLAHFIAESPQHRPLREKLDELRRLSDGTAFKGLPPESVRDVVTAVALLEIAGSNLVWRGHGFDREGLRAIFAGETHGADILSLLRAFTVRTVVLLVERRDAEASRLLADFAETAAAAETFVRQQRWLREHDKAGLARLLRCALLPMAELQRETKALHERYAGSTDPAAEKLFRLSRPSRAESVVTVWLGGAAGVFGFLTHEQWAERELARLRAEGDALCAGLFWSRVHRALAACTWVFGHWWWIVPAWLVLAAALALVWPGPRWLPVALMPLAAAFGARMIGAWLIRRQMRQAFPATAGWRWLDGAARSLVEATATAGGRTSAELEHALRDINAEMAKLTALPSRPAPLRGFSGAVAFWCLSIGSWMVVAGEVGAAAWHARTQRPTWAALVKAWNPPPPTPAELAARTAGAKRARHGEEAEASGPVRVSWPFKAGDEPDVLRFKAAVEPTGEQLRAAAERARDLAALYKPETITTDVVLRVPADGKIILMVYDLRRLQPVAARVYLLDYAPLARSWVELDRHTGIYLPD